MVLDGTKIGATVENGVLTVPDGALVYAANSADLSDLESKTVFLKVRLSGNISTGMPNLLYHAASYRICGGGYNAASAESGGPYERRLGQVPALHRRAQEAAPYMVCALRRGR